MAILVWGGSVGRSLGRDGDGGDDASAPDVLELAIGEGDRIGLGWATMPPVPLQTRGRRSSLGPIARLVCCIEIDNMEGASDEAP